MTVNCEYCGHENLEVLLEYSFDLIDEEATHFEIGTVNAVCKQCNREQYLTPNELPREVRSRLENQ